MNELDNNWQPEKMLEVQLKEPDDFLKVRETLTRIGVASRKDKKLFQSCHILHKQGRYFIVHFKELFALDGKAANLSDNDVDLFNRLISNDPKYLKYLNDFELSISGGTATISSATPSGISSSGNVYTLEISLNGTPDGSEVLMVDHNVIYDLA